MKRPGRAALGAALGTAVLATGCGGSGKSPSHSTTVANQRPATPALCLPEVRYMIAGALAVDPETITTATGVGTNGNPQCTFTAQVGRHQRVTIIANEYTGSQPYFILERTEIEASQVFTPSRQHAAPEAIMHLGLEAAWFPATQALMATDALRLIEITFQWPGASLAQERDLGVVLARPYLKTTKTGEKLAHGYP